MGFYEARSGRKLRELQGVGIVTEVAFSPDGKIVAAAGDGLRLWNVNGGAELATLTGHAGRVNALAFAVSGVFMLIPGPNLLAYYFAVRLVGHYLSWRGARCALKNTTWDVRSEPALAELAGLASTEPAARAPRVEAIARALDLPQLPAFFERAAASVR